MDKKSIWHNENEISPGFRCPDGAITTAIPICNVCLFRGGIGKCKNLGDRTKIYRHCESRDCTDAVLDKNALGYGRYMELYPDDKHPTN